MAPGCDKNIKLAQKKATKNDGGHRMQSAGLNISPLKEEQKMALKAYLYAFSLVLWITRGSDVCQVL